MKNFQLKGVFLGLNFHKCISLLWRVNILHESILVGDEKYFTNWIYTYGGIKRRNKRGNVAMYVTSFKPEPAFI